jgi:hypothetical protein
LEPDGIILSLSFFVHDPKISVKVKSEMVSIVILSIMGLLLAALFVGRALEVILPGIRERKGERAAERPDKARSIDRADLPEPFSGTEHS